MIGVSSEQSKVSFECIHSCCCRYLLLLLWVLLMLFYFSFCYVDTVCGFTIDYLDLMDYMHTVRCWTTYEYVFVCACHVLL